MVCDLSGVGGASSADRRHDRHPSRDAETAGIKAERQQQPVLDNSRREATPATQFRPTRRRTRASGPFRLRREQCPAPGEPCGSARQTPVLGLGVGGGFTRRPGGCPGWLVRTRAPEGVRARRQSASRDRRFGGRFESQVAVRPRRHRGFARSVDLLPGRPRELAVQGPACKPPRPNHGGRCDALAASSVDWNRQLTGARSVESWCGSRPRRVVPRRGVTVARRIERTGPAGTTQWCVSANGRCYDSNWEVARLACARNRRRDTRSFSLAGRIAISRESCANGGARISRLGRFGGV